MTTRVNTAEDAARLFDPALADDRDESVVALHLDSDRRMIGMDVYPVAPGGDGEGAGMPVRAILAEALRCGSTILIIGRNHPGGDPMPTEQECAATRYLAHAAGLLDIRLEDHLICGGGEWRSFRQLGLI